MDIIIGMIITFCVLILSIFKRIFVGFPLLLAFFIFVFISLRRGFSLNAVIKLSIDGGKKSFIVLKIFILIGSITGIWMASGTVPAIIYYGITYTDRSIKFFIFRFPIR